MQHCESCGSEAPDRARFCGFCGHPLNTVAARTVTDIGTGSLPATREVVTDISTVDTGPLPASSPQDISTGRTRVDETETQRRANPSKGEDGDDEQEDVHSIVLVDVAVTPMPAKSVPMVQGTPSIGNVPMVQGTPSANSPTHIMPSPTQQPLTALENRHSSYSSHPPSQPTRTSSFPLHRSYTGPDAHEKPPVQRKGRRKRAIVLIVLLLIVLFTVFGGALVLARIIFGSPASSATVTITPASADLKSTYTISVVTGTPDASKNQVGGARMLSATTSSFTQTVNATGQGTIPGTQASGMLRVEDYDASNSLTLTAGTVFSNQNSPPVIHMQLDQTVTLPPGGFTEVHAHVVEVGTIGNLPGACCGSSPNFQNQCSPGVNNCGQAYDVFNSTAFTGGKDPQTYSVVQQSDIDGAAHSLEQAHPPNAQQVLQGKVHANERFIGGPQCKPNVTSDYAAGDQATNVTVTVMFACTGEVYDQMPALAMVTKLLTDQAATNPGREYALVGNIATTVTNAALANAGRGTVTLTVDAEGVWAYQFSATQKQALAKLMANKKKQDVQALLLKQQGVVRAAIQLIGGDGTLFPTDPGQIKIVVRNVPGAL